MLKIFDKPLRKSTSEKINFVGGVFQDICDMVENDPDIEDGDHKVDVFDMTAGAGHYDNVIDGSTISVIAMAKNFPSIQFNMTFFESNPRIADELKENLSFIRIPRNVKFKIVKRKYEPTLQRMIKEGFKTHTFICIDPCKVTLPTFDEVVKLGKTISKSKYWVFAFVSKQTAHIHRPVLARNLCPNAPKQIFGATKEPVLLARKHIGDHLPTRLIKLWFTRIKHALVKMPKVGVLGPIPFGSGIQRYHGIVISNEIDWDTDPGHFIMDMAEWTYNKEDLKSRLEEFETLNS